MADPRLTYGKPTSRLHFASALSTAAARVAAPQLWLPRLESGQWPAIDHRSPREDDDVPVGFEVASERFQKFNQVGFLRRRKVQCEPLVIVIDHRQQIRRTAIVKIRGMLPEPS